MHIFFEDESKIDFTDEFEPETLAREIFEAFLDFSECPYEAEVSLLMVKDTKIQEINKAMRNIDQPTDVLSFPMNDFPIAGEFFHLEEIQDAFHPETGELLLGDIVISAEHVESQAKAYGHSRRREFAFLMVHSLLHLIGYDHMEEKERARMEEKQNEFLNFLGIGR